MLLGVTLARSGAGDGVLGSSEMELIDESKSDGSVAPTGMMAGGGGGGGADPGGAMAAQYQIHQLMKNRTSRHMLPF